jgi:hypothetical protein
MKRGGFASIMAVVLLGLVSLAAFSIFAMLTADSRRTRGAEVDAQLRQMLMAGATDVMIHSTSWDEKASSVETWDVELPAVLKQEEASLKAIPTTPAKGAVTVVIEAHLQKHQAFETLSLARVDNRWQIKSSRWGR